MPFLSLYPTLLEVQNFCKGLKVWCLSTRASPKHQGEKNQPALLIPSLIKHNFVPEVSHTFARYLNG